MANRSTETATTPSADPSAGSPSQTPPENTQQTGTRVPEAPEQQTSADQRAVFRTPPVALLAVLLLFMCVVPIAAAAPGLQVLLLVPLALAVWIIRTRTTATSRGLFVRTFLSSRTLSWDSLQGLAITQRSRVQAVLNDGSSLTLPTVRTRHVPVLSLISQGRVADPSGVLDGTEE